MTPADQIHFVRQLTDSITDETSSDILAGKIPETWDGLELRQLLAHRFARAVFKFTRSRKAAYHNTVLINNL